LIGKTEASGDEFRGDDVGLCRSDELFEGDGGRVREVEIGGSRLLKRD